MYITLIINHKVRSVFFGILYFSHAVVFWVGAHNSLSQVLVRNLDSEVITIQNSVQRYPVVHTSMGMMN